MTKENMTAPETAGLFEKIIQRIFNHDSLEKGRIALI
jgi:hypothetical protein